MHSNPSSLKAGRIVFSDFWLIGVELVMGRVQVGYQKSRAFLPWFSGFWVPEPITNLEWCWTGHLTITFIWTPLYLNCFVSVEPKPIIIKGFVSQPLTEWSNNLKNDPFSVIKIHSTLQWARKFKKVQAKKTNEIN